MDTSHNGIWCKTRQGDFGQGSVGEEKLSIPSLKKLELKT